MALITPFRGMRFDNDIISDVVTPPYDVIGPNEVDKFYNRHPNNVIRLDLGKKHENDSEKENKDTRASAYFRKWIEEGILKREDEPSIYLTSVEFLKDGVKRVRYGMLARVGLEPFEKGVVLPHERTFSKVKSERLDLIKACHANFSPVFSIFPDQNGQVLETLKNLASSQTPEIDLVDDDEMKHRLFVIKDKKVIDFLIRAMADKRLVIADGHHRYETALNYRQWVKENEPGFTSDHPANFVMMYLCSMQDPGLLVLPAHRMLLGLDDALLSSFLEKAGRYFHIERIPLEKEKRVQVLDSFKAGICNDPENCTIGVFIKGSKEIHLLNLNKGVMNEVFAGEISNTLASLDVTVLTRLIFMKILGFDQARLDNEKLISYSSDTAVVIDSIIEKKVDMAFILNPTKIEQILRIADEGLVMPRKATYFFPKALTGLVLNSLDPEH